MGYSDTLETVKETQQCHYKLDPSISKSISTYTLRSMTSNPIGVIIATFALRKATSWESVGRKKSCPTVYDKQNMRRSAKTNPYAIDSKPWRELRSSGPTWRVGFFIDIITQFKDSKNAVKLTKCGYQQSSATQYQTLTSFFFM
jgi:hypothetical protein